MLSHHWAYRAFRVQRSVQATIAYSSASEVVCSRIRQSPTSLALQIRTGRLADESVSV